jgi:hypothetical protein
MRYSNYLEEKVLLWIDGTNFPSAPTTLYFSVHSADPSDTGASEVTATYFTGRASYTASNFSAPATVGANRQIKNSALIDFDNSISAGSVFWIGIWDAATSGNFLCSFELVNASGEGEPLVFGNGDPVTISSNALEINLSITTYSIYFTDAILGWLKGTAMPSAPTTVYAGWYTSLTASNVGTEVTTSIRVAGRVAVSFGTVTDEGTAKLLTNNAIVDFGASNSPVTGVYILGLLNAATAGNLIGFLQTAPRDIIAGQPVNLPSGYIRITVS